MIVLDYGDRRPLFEQVTARFQDLILRGVLPADSPMPSVRQLAMELSINPNTIQRAYAALERAGWIYSVRGKGSFVSAAAEAKELRRKELSKKLTSLIEEAVLIGVTKEEFLSSVENASWPQEVAGNARTDEGTERQHDEIRTGQIPAGSGEPAGRPKGGSI